MNILTNTTMAKITLCSTLLLSSLITSSVQPSTAQAASSGVSIMLDGYALPFPVQPVAIKGTTMVPFRAISEALGITVQWNQASKTITATKKENTTTKKVVLTMGSTQATVDGTKVSLALAPQTISNNTMIPLSFFSQQFGARVLWDQASKTVSITSPQEDLYTMGFYALSSYDERAMIPDFDSMSFGWSRIDLNGNFTIADTGKEYRWPQSAGTDTPESIIQNTATQGTSPYLMVYAVDGHGELTKNLENLTLQQQTIKGIIDTATQKGFKGITLDFEGLGLSGDKLQAQKDYNVFIKNIATQAHQANLKLTVVLHPLNSSYQGYDYRTLGTLADDIIIMAYAYDNEKSPEPLAKVDQAITLALKQVNKSKLILGISLGSENANSVNAKIGLAKRYDLKGISIWRLGIVGQAAWNTMHESVEFK